jgi:hypothetical protein
MIDRGTKAVQEEEEEDNRIKQEDGQEGTEKVEDEVEREEEVQAEEAGHEGQKNEEAGNEDETFKQGRAVDVVAATVDVNRLQVPSRLMIDDSTRTD